MPKRSAIVTGVTGQDGSYLTRDLLADGYRVIGVTDPDSDVSKQWRLVELGVAENSDLEIIELDITNPNQVLSLVEGFSPHEIYNLASHSLISDCELNPHRTVSVTGMAVVNILEGIRVGSPKTKFLQAGSSEMYGFAERSPQNENSKFSPRNIYGTAKLFAHWSTHIYRVSSGLFSANAILYNHESPLRAQSFVTRKITSNVARINLGKLDQLRLGNLSAIRDWGWAPEYVSGMRSILAQDEPDTFNLATGIGTSVREFVRLAFAAAEIDVIFSGTGLSEQGFDSSTGNQVVSIDPEHYRTEESTPLVGDTTKSETILGWKAQTALKQIVQKMVERDVADLSNLDT